MSGEFFLYQAPDGTARIQLRVSEGTVWLTQKQLAELYQVSVPAIAQHIRNIFLERELKPEATVKDYLIVAPEGARNVERRVAHYRLEMVLAVGYRVRSERGSQFRRWTIETLKNYLIKTKKAMDTDTAEVQVKAKAAVEWCRHASDYSAKHGGKLWRYLLIPHDAVLVNATLDRLAGHFGLH